MRTTMCRRRFGGLGLIFLGLGLLGGNVCAVAQDAPRFEVADVGVVPRPVWDVMLLGLEPVRQELKITEAQKKEQEAIQARRFREIQQARRDLRDNARFIAAREAIFQKTEAAQVATLKPEQLDRLAQLRLQLQGPLAFAQPDYTATPGEIPLVEKLKLSDDQVRRVRAVVEAGQAEIKAAASIPIVLDTKGGPPTSEAVARFVDDPEFQASKQKARESARHAWADAIRRVESVLNDAQRESYHQKLGTPVDLARFWSSVKGERQADLAIVSRAFGLGGQRADTDFDTKVARPAYANGATRPRVLFDEAHFNFHTSTGRYKPFGQLIGNDGYQVIPNRDKFTAEVLKQGEILVIANALGAAGMGQPGASNPAFTDAECDAVRDWIKGGGSLLFITDHAPMGAAAECLAKRFEVNLNKGATSDPANSEENDTYLVFTRQNRLLGDHPITRGRDDSERVNRIKTFTGTSLKGPAESVPILKLADTAIDLPSGENGKETSAAGRVQGLALKFGKGRVVVLGEAAELSAQVVGIDDKFGMNVPGLDNRQMALNIMHWLSGLLEPGTGQRR